jgi:hypothetical protein
VVFANHPAMVFSTEGKILKVGDPASAGDLTPFSIKCHAASSHRPGLCWPTIMGADEIFMMKSTFFWCIYYWKN